MAGENRNGEIHEDFADGHYVFRLPIGQMEELQEKTGCGPYRLAIKMMSGDWGTKDVSQTIRLSLIGGGMEPIPALKLVQRYVEPVGSNWLDHADLAQRIVWAALRGAPEELPGKESEPEATSEGSNSPTDALPSVNSTQQPEQPE